MVNDPLVSIVTPSLDRAALIDQTIASVRAQTYPNVEHIVVDGGSTDGTLDVLRKWEAGGRLRWTSQPDDGMYDAINRGFSTADGEILAYLNSDDLYFPWTVEAVVRTFREHPEADLVFGDALSIDQRSGAQRIHWQAPFDLDYIRRSGFLAQPCVFLRRRVLLQEGPFDASLRFVADCEYWMRVGERHRFVKADELVAIERDHDATLRFRNSVELAGELTAVRSRYVRLRGPGHRISLVRHRFRIAAWRRRYWLALIFAGRFGIGRSRAWSSFLAHPSTRISYRWAAALLVPRIGSRVEDKVLDGSTWIPDVKA